MSTKKLKVASNNSSLQQNNRSAVLFALSDGEVHTRAEIARDTGLTQASITNIVSAFQEVGVVHETGQVAGQLGRRSVGIKLNEEYCKVVAVKLARKSYDIAVFNWMGKITKHIFVPITNQMSATYVIKEIIDTVKDLIDSQPGIKAIGVALPGPYLSKRGQIALMSEFSGWDQINIREKFESNFDIPIRIEHDANAGALAEWFYGNGIEQNDVLAHLLISEGVGSGIIHTGEMLLGYDGIFGEIGHTSIDFNGSKCSCGNKGCFEHYCSALSFAKWVQKELYLHPESSLTSEKKITAEIIFEHMRNGDLFSKTAVHRVAQYIGRGIVNMIYAYNPNIIVISDIMTGGGEEMLQVIRSTVREHVLPVLAEKIEIRFSDLRHDTILLGAKAVAVEHLLLNPNLLCGDINLAV